ncbi:glycoside hydrolase family 32 protein [Robinsoniella peoriensis]
MNAMQRDLAKLVREKEESGFKEWDDDQWRPGFHLMPVTGWLNDPNGLCYYKGFYHVFFQYSPFDENGGVKFWGHYKSKNLTEWEYLGTALYADQPYDCHGVYSGSAYIEEDTMYLYYTGNVKLLGDFDYVNKGRESNTVLAISKDGISFENKNCIMTNADYPSNCTCHVRDPKVWREGDRYYMVQGARRRGTVQGEDIGEVLLFESEDKVNWQIWDRITSENPFGYMWECPDYFQLDGVNILAVCPQGVNPEGIRYRNIYQCGYFTADKKIMSQCRLSDFTELDYGFDFYAPQTFQDEKGRRIMIGWAGMPDADYTNPTAQKENWQHCMSVPRVLEWKNGQIFQRPVEELQMLRQEKISEEIAGCFVHKGLSMYEIEFFVSLAFEIRIAQDLVIKYKPNSREIVLSLSGSLALGRTSRTVFVDKMDKIHLLVDNSILEVFINDGEKVMTTRFYPKEKVHDLMINADSGKVHLWKLDAMGFRMGE